MKSRQSIFFQSSFFQSILVLISLSLVAMLAACGGSSHSTPPPPNTTVSIAATSGTPQSAVVGAAFGAPLVATVTTGGTPTSGVTVTFAPPTSGASGSFAGGANTATTNASGVATSPAFTANSTAGAYTVTASVSGASSPASFSLTNTAAPVESIAATSGTPQSAVAGAAFAAPLVATVMTGSTPTSGVTVTFTAPASGASGTFATTPPSATATATTNASGVATSPAFTANTTAGLYTVTASTTGVSTPVGFTLNNTLANTLADGTYVFSLAGETTTTNGTSNYNLSGAFVVSGGAITNGEQDYVDGFIYAPQDSITSGTITATADGNLQIVLTTNDLNLGVNGNGIETIDGALFSASRGRIIAFDNNATSSGGVSLQDSTAATTTPSAGYAFFTGGTDVNGNPVAIGGVINIDNNPSAGDISGANSIFDGNDDGSGTTFQGETFTASTVSAPDTFGRVLFTLNATDTTDFPQINLAGYIVDSSHIRLVEEEPTGTNFGGGMGGVAIGQGANTNTFTSISGNGYVLGLEGAEPSFSILQTAGVLTASASGNTISGAINYNDLSGTGPTTPSTVTGGTYTVDSTGRVTMTGVTDGIATFNIQMYLTGSGVEAEVTAITMDAGDIQAGPGFQQTGGPFSAASLAGTYVMNATGDSPATNEPELDAVGPVAADGVSALSGIVDLNNFSVSQAAALPVSGTFTASANGAFTGTITGLDVTTATNADVFVYYLIDTSSLFAIETDTNQLTLGFFVVNQ
jgi:hypothetical protein